MSTRRASRIRCASVRAVSAVISFHSSFLEEMKSSTRGDNRTLSFLDIEFSRSGTWRISLLGHLKQCGEVGDDGVGLEVIGEVGEVLLGDDAGEGEEVGHLDGLGAGDVGFGVVADEEAGFGGDAQTLAE